MSYYQVSRLLCEPETYFVLSPWLIGRLLSLSVSRAWCPQMCQCTAVLLLDCISSCQFGARFSEGFVIRLINTVLTKLRCTLWVPPNSSHTNTVLHCSDSSSDEVVSLWKSLWSICLLLCAEHVTHVFILPLSELTKQGEVLCGGVKRLQGKRHSWF